MNASQMTAVECLQAASDKVAAAQTDIRAALATAAADLSVTPQYAKELADLLGNTTNLSATLATRMNAYPKPKAGPTAGATAKP